MSKQLYEMRYVPSKAFVDKLKKSWSNEQQITFPPSDVPNHGALFHILYCNRRDIQSKEIFKKQNMNRKVHIWGSKTIRKKQNSRKRIFVR